jgi:FkbM family methyltransferase
MNMTTYDSRGHPRIQYGYTQNEEEKYIVQNARGTRFLDIGAYDGETFSSTRALVHRGWSGAYVEPNPLTHEKLREVAALSNSEIIPFALGSECGELTFYMNGDMVSTIDKSHADKWAHATTFTETTVKVIDVQTLADTIGYDYDFLNLDVEGVNWDVLTQFDFTKWKFNTLCIEYDDKLTEMTRFLESYGFRIVYISPENIVAVR